jgi:hypothetical protein
MRHQRMMRRSLFPFGIKSRIGLIVRLYVCGLYIANMSADPAFPLLADTTLVRVHVGQWDSRSLSNAEY